MAGQANGEAKLELPIEGMTCASCVNHVDKALANVPGESSGAGVPQPASIPEEGSHA